MDQDLTAVIDEWAAAGWIRELERAFVCFLARQAPDTPPAVLLAALLVSHQLGRGHVCLDLAAALDDPENTLALPPRTTEAPELPTPARLLSGVGLANWKQQLMASDLVSSGDAEAGAPLVLAGNSLYLRRYWQYTRQVADSIRQKLSVRFDLPDDLGTRLGELFGDLSQPAQDKTQTDWQKIAVALTAGNAFSVISGGPGTGKTTIVVKILMLLQALVPDARPLRIALAAPTGRAAARLGESVVAGLAASGAEQRQYLPVRAVTLHRLLGSRPNSRRFVHDRHHPLPFDGVIVDEASMIDLEMMAALLDALPPAARLILLGDKDQLASVEAGAVLSDICRNAETAGYSPSTVRHLKRYTGYDLSAFEGAPPPLARNRVVLRTSYRFGPKSGIAALAKAVNAGDSDRVEKIWQQGCGDIARLDDLSGAGLADLVINGHPALFTDSPSLSEAKKPAGYGAYLALVKAGPGNGTEADWLQNVMDAFARFQLLTPLREGPYGVSGLNARITGILFRNGLIHAKDGWAQNGWYPGRPVLVTRNDYQLGLMNGDTGLVLPVTDETRNSRKNKTLRAVFQNADGRFKKIPPARLNAIETVFAMTVHKAQGAGFDHTALVLPDEAGPVLTRELIYTAITRSRRWFTLVAPRPAVLPLSIARRVHRASGLAGLLEA